VLSWGEVLLVMFRLFRCVTFRRGAFRRVLLHCVRVRLLRLPTFLCVSVCLGEVCLVKAVAFSLSGLFLGVLSSVKAVE